MESLKLVIVGHVDHGKSTLIGRLLYDTNSLPEGKMDEIKEICKALGREVEFGFIMDHLEEERDQGITIDTTQIFFKTNKRKYVIIDAPGHVEFIKNMITGASQAEAAILIVDATEGVQEQTKRHSYILNLLGLKQIVVIINKMDLVDYKEAKYNEVKNELIEFLNNINITPKAVIPISAKNGYFIAKKNKELSWYKGPTVLESLDLFHIRKLPVNQPLRFCVQDVYKYEKRIAVGKVESGELIKGDKIKILPSGEETVVESIEEFLKDDVKKAEAGKNTGLVTKDKVFLDRGNIIVSPENLPTITDIIHANIFNMDKMPLTKREKFLFKCATQEIMCHIEKIEKVINSSTLEILGRDVEKINDKEVAEIIIKTEKPIVIEDFNYIEALGRFVLERNNITCAGGIIKTN